MTALLFPRDTSAPLPRAYTVRVRDGWFVKLHEMKAWERDCWMMMLEAMRDAKL